MPENRGVDIKVKTTTEGQGILDRVVKGLGDVKAQGGAASKAIDGFVGLIKGPFAAAAGVVSSVAAAFAGLTKSVREYANAQESVIALDAALAQQGILTDEYRQRLQALASELQAVTAVGDDQWLDVLTRLTQFGSRPESIGMDIEAVKNLAGIVGNVTTAANLYSRALQGQYEAFGRYGIQVKEAGSQTEKLRELQEQLAQRGGGQLEARARSLNGVFTQLKNSTGDLLEAIGQQTVRITRLDVIVGGIADAMGWWAEVLGDTVEKLDGLNNVTVDTAKALDDYKKQSELVAKASEKITSAATDEIAAIRRKKEAIDELVKAQTDLQMAEVDAAVQAGRLSPVAGARAKAGIQAAARRGQYERDQMTDAAELAAQERALADLTTLDSDMTRRARVLQSQIRSGRVGQSRYQDSARMRADLEEAIRAIESENGPGLATIGASLVGRPNNQARLAELRRQLAVVGNAQPVSVAEQEAELAALTQAQAGLAPRIAAAREAIVRSPIASQMAQRSAVFPLVEAREGITAGAGIADAQGRAVRDQLSSIESGGRGISASVGNAAGAVQSAMQESARFNRLVADEITRFRAQLQALQAQVKNAQNK